MSTPVETIRRFYELVIARDFEMMGRFLDDTVWHIPGENALAGTFRGADEIVGSFKRGAELSGGTLEHSIHDIVGDEEHAVALDRIVGSRPDGRRIEMNRVVIAHVTDGGLLQEVWVNPEDGYAFDEFWR